MTTTTTPHARVIDAFHQSYLGLTGTKPTWTGVQTTHVKRLLKIHGEDEIMSRLERFFISRVPSWVWRDGTPDFLTFVRVFDQVPQAGNADPRIERLKRL